MEAVILAGGLGTRLRPLTMRRPKHLLPVGGVPFLEHQLTKLAQAGVRHVVLATSYYASDFEPVFGDGSRWDIEISYVTEERPLGTGGGLRNAAAVLRADPEEPVVVLNGDQLSGHDIRAQVDHLIDAGADVSLHLVEVPDPRDFGCVPTDQNGHVVAFVEKSPDPVSRQINAGCYVLRRRVIDQIPTDQVVSIERETFPALLRDGALLLGFAASAYWRDVGTPDALVRASCDLVRGIATSPAHLHPPSERRIADDADVAQADLVRGGSVVGERAGVEAGAVVDGSVVMAGAVIEGDARVVGSVVGPGARIGRRTCLRSAAVGDGARVGDDCELFDGARVACDAVIPDASIRISPG